jgi:hypothetical protein
MCIQYLQLVWEIVDIFTLEVVLLLTYTAELLLSGFRGLLFVKI